MVDLLQGFTPYRLKNFLTSNLLPPLSPTKVDQVLIEFQTFLLDLSCSRVWAFRNKSLKEFQRHLGITKKSLKKKFRDRDRSVQLPALTRPSHNNLNIFYPPATNLIISNLINYGSRMQDVF